MYEKCVKLNFHKNFFKIFNSIRMKSKNLFPSWIYCISYLGSIWHKKSFHIESRKSSVKFLSYVNTEYKMLQKIFLLYFS